MELTKRLLISVIMLFGMISLSRASLSEHGETSAPAELSGSTPSNEIMPACESCKEAPQQGATIDHLSETASVEDPKEETSPTDEKRSEPKDGAHHQSISDSKKSIAAVQKPNIFTIFDKIIEWFKQIFWKNCEMELAVVGLENSGKSTFVRLIATDEFREDRIPTSGFNMRKINKGRVNIKVWDLGGQRRFRTMWARYCRGSSAIIYMVDATDRANLGTSNEELHSLLKNPELANIPILVLGNKRDLPNAMDAEELITKMELDSIKDRELTFLLTSCKDRTNIDVALQWLISNSKSPWSKLKWV